MAKSPNAIELLRKDHKSVMTLLRRFERSEDEREQRDLCEEIVAELEAHASLEEDCFYPFVRDATDRVDLIEEATIEHETARQLMTELRERDVDPLRFHALVSVLGEYVTLHVREEEERIFPIVEKLGVDLEALGEELAERRKGLGQAGHAGNARERDRLNDAENRNRSAGAARKRSSNASEHRAANEEDEATGDGDVGHEDDATFLREHGDELSRSTQHAKWIHDVDEHEDHPGQTLATRNPEVIRRWAEERNATPATTPNADAERPRVLRFDFPDYDKSLQEISWDAWLGTFEERDLVFLFQERMKAGNQSNFFRLDSPQREDA
jgi:hemerythrin superfamily protein